MPNRRASSRTTKLQKDALYYDDAEVSGMFDDSFEDEDGDDSDEDPTFEDHGGDVEEDLPHEESDEEEEEELLGKRKRDRGPAGTLKRQKVDNGSMTSDWIIRKNGLNQKPSNSPFLSSQAQTVPQRNFSIYNQNPQQRIGMGNPAFANNSTSANVSAFNTKVQSFTYRNAANILQMNHPHNMAQNNNFNMQRMPTNNNHNQNNIHTQTTNDTDEGGYIPPPVEDNAPPLPTTLIHQNTQNQNGNRIVQVTAPPTSEQSAAESAVKQLLFDHFKRTQSRAYTREASLALLKQQIATSPDYVEALKRIQSRAKSKETVAPMMGGQRQQGFHELAGSNQYAPSTLGMGHFHGVNTNAPLPPLVKQTLNAQMANSLFQQTGGVVTGGLTGSSNTTTTSNGTGDDANNASGEPTEDEHSLNDIDINTIEDVDEKIEITMKRCDAISKRLRESLQNNLRSLLETDSVKDVEEETKEEQTKVKAEKSVESMKTETPDAAAAANGVDSKPVVGDDDSGVTNWFGTTLTPKSATTDATTTTTTTTEATTEKKESNTDKKNEYIVREQPNTLQLALKEYQLVGLNWLNLLHRENVNGILADEMGLGKTIQTISLLALLYEQREPNVPTKPHFIICPSTTLTNWMRELHVWCPVLRVVAYYGTPNERDIARKKIQSEHFDVIITTYNVAGQKKDRLFFKKQKFNYFILDEAQSIKNNQSLRHQYLRKLQSEHRLLLTGTPLQNNLDELWALLQFIMPTIFSFDIDFQSEENSGMNENRVNRMKAIMAPFVLRRLKQHVSRGIPPKKEEVHSCQMTEIQQTMYQNCVQSSRSWWERIKREQFEEIEIDVESDNDNPLQSPDLLADDDDVDVDVDDTTSKPKTKAKRIIQKVVKKKTSAQRKADQEQAVSSGQTLSNVFMELRKIANHPLLARHLYDSSALNAIADYLATLDENKKKKRERIYDDLSELSDFRVHQICRLHAPLAQFLLSPQQLQSSGKAELLKTLLHSLHTDGHRVLIFSQMTRVLDILEELLGLWGYEFLRLDGSTPVAIRQHLIDKYNSDKNVFIFLLSTRAGGVGINLTSADSVIFYDIAFNPQVDRQAEDRCHRFGQTKPVTIYKLITSSTVDQNMLDMAERKSKLNDIMLEEGSKKKENTKVWQLRSLLSSVFDQ